MLLPWHREFARQYLASPWDGWKGNRTLLDVYERMAHEAGEVRITGAEAPNSPRVNATRLEQFKAWQRQHAAELTFTYGYNRLGVD